MRATVWCLCLFPLLSMVGIAYADSIDDAYLNYYIQQIITYSKSADSPGVAVAVIKDNQILFMKAYGLRDRANQLPVTVDTLFNVGSITKGMTGFALAMAEQSGVCSLDAPLEEVLPDFNLNGASFSAQINSIDLLSHRTGIPGYVIIAWKANYTADQYYSRIPFLDLSANPSAQFRKSFHYSNEMYLVAGKLLEKVSGETWEQNIQRQVFGRLWMTSSGFLSTPASVNSNMALPYLGGARMTDVDIAAIPPAGAVRSSLRDMAQWTRFMASQGKDAQGNQIVPVATMERLVQLDNVMGQTPAGTIYYGLGWTIRQDPAAGRFVSHSGNVDGYYSSVSFMPELQLGVVVLTNDQQSVLATNVSAIAYRYLSARYFSTLGYLDTTFGLGYLAPTLTTAQQQLYQAQLNFERGTSNYYLTNVPACFATYRHPGIGDLRLCTGSQSYLLSYGANYWPMTFKSYDPVSKNLVYEVSFLVQESYVTSPITFLPDADGRYPRLSMPFGGFRETREVFESIFNLVGP